MGSFNAYGLPAAGVAAAGGVDAAGLVNRLAIAYQEAEQRKRRNDIEQGAMLYNVGDVQGAQQFLGASGPLEDPIQRAVRQKSALEAAEPPKTLQQYLIQLFGGRGQNVPGASPPTGAPPAPPTAPPVSGTAPQSMTDIRRTPPTAQIQGPDMSRIDTIIDLLSEKQLDEKGIMLRNIRRKLEAGQPLTGAERVNYAMGTLGMKDPGEAALYLALTGQYDPNDKDFDAIYKAALAKMGTSGELNQARIAQLIAQVEKTQALIESKRGELELHRRRLEEVEKPRVAIEGGRAGSEAEAKKAEIENRKQQRRQAFTSNLTRVQNDFEDALARTLPGPQQEDVKRRFLQTIKSTFEAEIQEEDDPNRKAALKQRMVTEMSKYRPALKLELK